MILTENGVLKLMQRIKSFITAQLNTKAASVHTHTLSEIDDLSTLSMGGGYTKSEVDTLLTGKADTSHTHTKSQITDFPTKEIDTIEEQGDGYIRYSNGLQICWGNISFTSSSQGWGNLYEGINTASQNYPKSFKSAPSVIAGSSGETYCMIESAYGNNVRTPILCAVRPMAFTNQNFTISYIAIGLWK